MRLEPLSNVESSILACLVVWLEIMIESVENHMQKESKKNSEKAEFEQMIAERAYHIWLSEGRPVGKDCEHWRRAEQELSGLGSQVESCTCADKEPEVNKANTRVKKSVSEAASKKIDTKATSEKTKSKSSTATKAVSPSSKTGKKVDAGTVAETKKSRASGVAK